MQKESGCSSGWANIAGNNMRARREGGEKKEMDIHLVQLFIRGSAYDRPAKRYRTRRSRWLFVRSIYPISYPSYFHFPLNSGPCDSLNCLGHLKHVYDDDDDDDDDTVRMLQVRSSHTHSSCRISQLS